MKTYFITGATGAVGSALVERLLFETNAQIRLLVRAENPVRLAQRLNALWAFWRISPDAIEIRARVKAISGDAILPRFGLNRNDYDALAEQCTHIVHSAGNVRMNLPLDAARSFALDSARQIVDLAEASRKRGALEKVEFVSTVGVAGQMPNVLPETWITQKREFHNTYEQAKAEAEDFIRKKVEEDGLPVTVHRPSMVVGDSRTGKIIHFQVFYHLCEFLSGRRTIGVVPKLENYFLDIVPADYAAKAIAWSSNRQVTSGHILHLCSGPDQAIGLMHLMRHVRRIFKRRGKFLPSKKLVSLGIFKSAIPLIRLFVSTKNRRAMKSLPMLFDYLSEQQQFENNLTKTLLDENGIRMKNPDLLLEKVLQYYSKFV